MWTWYRHEIWAALQTGRQMLLDEAYWQPPPIETFEGVCVEDIANRVIFIFGQCVSFCNPGDTGEISTDEKIATWQRSHHPGCRPGGLETKASVFHVPLLRGTDSISAEECVPSVSLFVVHVSTERYVYCYR